jgi:hypothetical protein
MDCRPPPPWLQRDRDRLVADQPVPDIVATLAPVLAATDRADHPLLIAMLERWAAGRYREWADAHDDVATVTKLTACADREEEIATRVEALYSDAVEVQAALAEANPRLADILTGSFAWRPIDEQFKLQAEAERLGASTWRSFARAADDTAAAEVFSACALLEEASADVLEQLIATGA